MLIKKHLLVFYFLLFSIISWSQNPLYYKIDKSKGLPSNNVYDIFQDTKGFMWFATNQGICRFDGKTFLSFTADFQTSKSGSNIKEDKYGRIWYSNFDGYLYYVENGKLKALNNTNTIGYVKFGISNDYLLVIERDYLAAYRLKDLKIEKKIALNTKDLIATHCSKNIFYLMGKDLILIDKNLKKKSVPLQKELYENFPAPIFQDSPKGLLFVSKYAKHFFVFDKTKFIKKQIEGKFNFIQNLAYDHETNWICTTQGVIRYQDDQINTKNTYFKDFNISYVFKDIHQNYWFSTISEGLLLVPSIKNNFIPFEKRANVISVCGNQLFIGTTNDNIYKSDLNSFKFNKIFDGGTNHEVYFLSLDSLHQKVLFTSNSFKTFDFYAKNKTEDILAVKDAQKIDQSFFAFAASGVCGFYRVSDNKSNWDNYLKNNAAVDTKTTNFYSLLNGVQGKSATYNPFNQTVYFATSKGLFLVNRNYKKELKKDNKSLYFYKIKCFGNQVIGLTTNEQLYSISPTNEIKLFDTKKLTNSERVIKFKIIKDYLYLFTPCSIYEYHFISKKSKKVIALNPEFEISDIARNASKVILANTHGFLILDSNNVNNANRPKFVVNIIEVNGVIKTKKELENLAFDQNNLKINFSILSFIPNQVNRLYYKINSERWQLLEDDSRNFKLSSLSPGSYTICFQTEFENKKSEITSLKIEIKKPFWLKYSFIAFVIILFLSILFLIYEWQIARIQKRNQLLLDKMNLEKNVNQSKLKAIKSQMNPHFFYNALNTLQSYILANEKKEAIDYLSKFSNLTRIILEMTEKDWISIADEIKTLTLYFEIEKVRFEDDFSFTVFAFSNVDTENTKIPSMLLQPFVENAVKHGLLHRSGYKEVKVLFETVKEDLIITVDDNGVGRKKSNELKQIKNKRHQSFATDALQNRIDLINQYTHKNISIQIIDKYSVNEIPTGTKVIIKIPLEI
ncbi:histidine kinase [Flavobacterium sp. RS13.1]|uniref:sensor histidine kinase n=1 Tax=Flavobacterium sp. RS13.1 TaxID=3400345 RepID=UPI003AAB42A0